MMKVLSPHSSTRDPKSIDSHFSAIINHQICARPYAHQIWLWRLWIFISSLCLSCAPGLGWQRAVPPPLKFIKVSDHYYYLPSRTTAGNVGAFVTEEGVLLVDTPPEKETASLLEALKRVTAKPVRWVVNTHLHEEHTGGNSYFLSQNIAVLGSQQMHNRLQSVTVENRSTPRSESPVEEVPPLEAPSKSAEAPRVIFARQMRIMVGTFEARIFALNHKAHTAADVVVFVPSEKVLQVGDLFVAGNFPWVDQAADGNAAGWIEGMRQVMDAVPLLKSAMPAPRQATTRSSGRDKTLEESIAVIPGHGPLSNFQELKELFESVQKLKAETQKAVSSGRGRDAFLNSPALAAFRTFHYLDNYAAQLFDALSAKP